MALSSKSLAVLSLVAGATLWGVIWYPFRLMHAAGIDGDVATLSTYLVALALGSLAFGGFWREAARAPGMLLILGLGAGWSIVSYVLGIMRGEVMRVLLLFYLAPLWTVPLARMVLAERPRRAGYAVIALALSGALVMLWQPALGLPWPRNAAEWLGLSSGISFALANVYVRKATQCGVIVKSLAVWAGTVLVGWIALLSGEVELRELPSLVAPHWPLIVGVGIAMMIMSLLLQYGLTRLPATQGIVIMLFELVVAAVTAYWLADELMTARDWVGGAMIIAATLFSSRLAAPGDARGP